MASNNIFVSRFFETTPIDHVNMSVAQFFWRRSHAIRLTVKGNGGDDMNMRHKRKTDSKKNHPAGRPPGIRRLSLSRNLTSFLTTVRPLCLILLGLPILMSSGRFVRADTLDERSSHTLDSWLATTLAQAPTKVRPQKIVPIMDDHIQSVFPNDRFYAISFATWPRPPSLPRELSSQMVARIQYGNSVEPIRNAGELTKFLAETLAGVGANERIRAVVLASLRLAEAVAKAGAYEFGPPEVSVAGTNLGVEATASTSVGEPARGTVTVRMQFTPEGTVLPGGIHIEDRTNPGPPPRG